MNRPLQRLRQNNFTPQTNQLIQLNATQRSARYDPTKTTVLRQAMVAQMNRRFAQLKRVIKIAIVDNDCFGLQTSQHEIRHILVQDNPCHNPPGPGGGQFCGPGGGGGGKEVALSKLDRLPRRDHPWIPDSKSDEWIDVNNFWISSYVSLSSGVNEKKTRVENIKISDLTPGQPVVRYEGVKQYINEPPGREYIPVIAKIGERNIIAAGHTRLAALSLQGIQQTKVRVAYFNSENKQVKPPLVHSTPTTHADLSTPARLAFNFPTSAEKKAAFLAWLQRQEDQGILETTTLPQVGMGIEQAWTDRFIKDSYARAVARARYDLGQSGYAVPALEATGGIVASLTTPPHVDRLGVVYSRCFDQLKGITSAMDSQISHILAQGLADGDNPITLARKLLATIDGEGAGTLGITDSLGRFIPAERRARMLARTEIIRAHAQGTLQEFRNWGVAGVNVVAEFVTAGFNVCPECERLAAEGPYTIEEAMNLIPVHPHCRCCWRPEPVGRPAANERKALAKGPRRV